MGDRFKNVSDEERGVGAVTSASIGGPPPRAEAEDMEHINRTSAPCYSRQGPGVGGSADITKFLGELTNMGLQDLPRVLDVGFGHGEFLVEAYDSGCKRVCGVEIAQAAIDHVNQHVGVRSDIHIETYYADSSHDRFPFEDDSFDFAACTETIEHLSNPYNMVSEVKRVLRHGGIFLLAFPMPEDNLGYGGGDHAHVYPGFLEQASFERFMMQLYFRQLGRKPNGSSAWYAFENYKGDGMVDIFEVIAGNYDENELYKPVK